MGPKVSELHKKLPCLGVGAEIKNGIVLIEIRDLECDSGVSHHSLKKVLRDELVRRKMLAERA
jgi:hypothetical protein